MSHLRLSRPAKSPLGPLFWLFIGACIFGWFYFKSAPSGDIARSIAAAGPDGVTAYFSSPEEAVVKINELLAARDWRRLARYYDFSMSSVPTRQVISGAYFTGGLAVPPEGAVDRPFPPGSSFLFSEPTELPMILRIVVAGPSTGAGAGGAPQASFFLQASPDGYRIIPADAAGRLNAEAATASKP